MKWQSYGNTGVYLFIYIITSCCPGLSEQLVSEVQSLQKELTVTRAKLKSAREVIKEMPSECESAAPFVLVHMAVA